MLDMGREIYKKRCTYKNGWGLERERGMWASDHMACTRALSYAHCGTMPDWLFHIADFFFEIQHWVGNELIWPPHWASGPFNSSLVLLSGGNVTSSRFRRPRRREFKSFMILERAEMILLTLTESSRRTAQPFVSVWWVGGTIHALTIGLEERFGIFHQPFRESWHVSFVL